MTRCFLNILQRIKVKNEKYFFKKGGTSKKPTTPRCLVKTQDRITKNGNCSAGILFWCKCNSCSSKATNCSSLQYRSKHYRGRFGVCKTSASHCLMQLGLCSLRHNPAEDMPGCCSSSTWSNHLWQRATWLLFSWLAEYPEEQGVIKILSNSLVTTCMSWLISCIIL